MPLMPMCRPAYGGENDCRVLIQLISNGLLIAKSHLSYVCRSVSKMVSSKFRLPMFLMGMALALSGSSGATDITWFQPTDATNSNV